MSQTIYVATNGNDSNPGTLDRPLLSIQRAIRTLPVGQGGSILIRGGDYVLDRPIRISDNEGGTPTDRLVIRNYGDEKVKLNGSKLAGQKLGAFIISSAQHIDIRGLDIAGSYTGISVVGNAEDVQILDNIVHDTEFTGIAGYGAELGSVKNIRVDGNTVYRTNLFNESRPVEQAGGWGMGITFSRTTGGSITNNTVYNNYGEGIGFTLANGAVASNNVVYDNFSVEMYMDQATNSTFENNFVFNTGNREYYRRYNNGNEAAATGIQLANEQYRDSTPIRNDIIRNNVVVGGDVVFGYGNYQVGGGLRDVLVTNNTFYADDSSRKVLAIDADTHQNSQFINNIFTRTDARQTVGIPANIAGLNFNRNLWSGPGAGPGLAISASDVNADPQFFRPGGLLAEDYQLRGTSPAIDNLGARKFTLGQLPQPPIARPANWITDFSQDGIGDLLWQNKTTGAVQMWSLGANDANPIRKAANIGLDADANWMMRGLIDLNGDGQAEALWQNQRSGDVCSWTFKDGVFQYAENILKLDRPDWEIVAMGDFNGDKKGDILWRNSVTQDVSVWLMDGAGILGAGSPRRLVGPSWQVVGLGDFDADGRTDVLWQNPQTNETELWQMDGATIAASTMLPRQASPLWQAIGVNDLTNDGKADLLWQNRQSGAVELWTMDGNQVKDKISLATLSNSNWQLVGAKDFVGGPTADLFWYNAKSGQTLMWEIEAGQIKRSQNLLSIDDPNWTPIATQDSTGDGKADVFWRNNNNGAVSVWQFGLDDAKNQITLGTSASLANVDRAWRAGL
jgi:Right handed beta helix region/FG-GAP-like repeat